MSDIYKGGYSISVNGKWREIHGLNNCIDEINFIVDDLVEQVENLKEENKELKDEHYKDETIQKLEKEKRELQDQLYRTFSISKSENEAITEWKNQHWTNQHNAPDLTTRLRKQGAIGGSFTYEFVVTEQDSIELRSNIDESLISNLKDYYRVPRAFKSPIVQIPFM